MTRQEPWRTCGLAIVMLAGVPRVASASDERSVRFELVGPPGCAEDGQLASAVRARTSRVRAAEAGETPDLTLHARVVVVRGAAKGELVLTDAHGASTRRELSGESCEAVVAGLALVAALAIDPSASTAPVAPAKLAPSPAPPPPPAPAPPPMPAHVPEPPMRAASPSETGVSTSEPSPASPPEMAEPSEPPHRWRALAGIEAGILGDGAPGAVGTGSLFLEVAMDSPKLVAPFFRLSVLRSLETTVTASPTEQATLAWTFGRAEGCPLHIGLADAFNLRPCAFVDAGALYASGSAPVNASSHLRPWFAAGALARLEWVTKDVTPGWDVVLGAEAGVVFPFARETFQFLPSTATVYQAPSVTGLASLGGGVRFP